MRNEKLANSWIKDFEERRGRKATPEEEAMFRALADKVPELTPTSDGPGYGDPFQLRPSLPQKSRYTEQEFKKISEEYPNARRFLAPNVPNPGFKKGDLDMLLKKLRSPKSES